MQNVTFIADFPFEENARDTRNYPAGWSGTVPDEVAEAALKAGAIEGSEPVAEEQAGDDTLADDADALRIDAGVLLIAQQVSVNVWSLGALLSMLFHARYVIHVTNEAPRPEKQGRPAAILSRLWSFAPRLPRLRRSASKGDTAKKKPRQTEREVPRKPSRLPADNQDLSVDERESSAKVAPRKKPRRRTDADAGIAGNTLDRFAAEL